jgi:uncharacterized membrane protein
MIHSLAEWIFSNVCHQQAARAWAPGGVPLALCQRCTGVYVGAAFFVCLLPWMRFRPSRALAVLHTVFILQMAVLGTHLLPHPASMRTLSGQLFIIGAGYFVWNNLRFGRISTATPTPLWKYALGIFGAVAMLQALVRAPFPAAGALLELLALLGVVAIFLGVTFTMGDLILRRRR